MGPDAASPSPREKVVAGDGPGRSSEDSETAQALDCWCHGVAHLLAVLGRDRAVRVMASLVVQLAERDPDLERRLSG